MDAACAHFVPFSTGVLSGLHSGFYVPLYTLKDFWNVSIVIVRSFYPKDRNLINRYLMDWIPPRLEKDWSGCFMDCTFEICNMQCAAVSRKDYTFDLKRAVP